MNVNLGHPVIRASETVTGSLGVIGARFIMDGGPSEGRFSLLEHPIIPRGMAAPVHMHAREDEYSFILEGQWGFWQGGKVVFAGPGDVVYKPRDVWHTFWNATDQPARLLEIISPAGFDQFFEELAALVASEPFDPEAIAALNSTYGLQVDQESTARIAAEYNLVTTPGG
jgi:mannose-6-phosphate isomerase-like protein (cupin superfamily)